MVPPPTRSAQWTGSAESTGTSAGSHRMEGPTRPAIRTCWSGCTSPRSTASCSHTSATGHAARPARPRRLCGRHRPDRHRARCARPPRTEQQLRERIAAYRPELQGTDAAREAAASCFSHRRCRYPPGRPTHCSPRRRWPCCRPGPGCRCGCPTCLRWRPPRSDSPDACWSAASGGRSPPTKASARREPSPLRDSEAPDRCHARCPG